MCYRSEVSRSRRDTTFRYQHLKISATSHACAPPVHGPCETGCVTAATPALKERKEEEEEEEDDLLFSGCTSIVSTPS